MYGSFHYKEKTVVIPSYLYNGNSYTDKGLYIETPRTSADVWLVIMVMVRFLEMKIITWYVPHSVTLLSDTAMESINAADKMKISPKFVPET